MKLLIVSDPQQHSLSYSALLQDAGLDVVLMECGIVNGLRIIEETIDLDAVLIYSNTPRHDELYQLRLACIFKSSFSFIVNARVGTNDLYYQMFMFGGDQISRARGQRVAFSAVATALGGERSTSILNAPDIPISSIDGLSRRNPKNVSKRQYEILQCLAGNLSNREIADKFGISIKTVKCHITLLFKALEIKTRYEARQYLNTSA